MQNHPFSIGDKVMRIARHHPGYGTIHPIPTNDAQEGVIYCVDWIGYSPAGRPIVTFTGMDPTPFFGWFCHNFRRIEEIKLCVEAAAKMKQPKKSTVLVGDGEEEG